MKALYEFRIDEGEAQQIFGPAFGRSLGAVRIIKLQADDPAFDELRRAHRDRLKRGHRAGVIYSWDVRRSYSRAELEQAEFIQFIPSGAFEPAGEDCGTSYDESTACPHCGAGRIQASLLALDLRRNQPEHDIHTTTLRRGKDVARSIADEVVVSDRLATLFRGSEASGFELAAVRKCDSNGLIEGWLQLHVTSHPVEATSPTTYGNNPFDLDEAGQYRCPLGHVAGLNLLTELTIDRGSWQGADIVATSQLSGRRDGALVPAPALVITKRLYRVLRNSRVKGARYEVVHLA